MNRYDLIESLVEPMVQATGKPAAVIRQQLDGMTSSELSLQRDRLISTGALRLSQSQIAQAEARGKAILDVRHKLAEAVVERQAQAAEFQAEQDSRLIPQRQQEIAEQERRDRAVFAQACRRFRFSQVEANFVLVRDKFPGQQLSMDEIQLAIDSDELGNLIPASESEIRQWETEEVEQYNTWLKSLDMETLRKIARENGAQIQRSTEWRTYQARQMKEALEPPPPPLPWRNPQTGELWDAAFFRRMGMTDVPLFTKFVKKYRSQITARLNGLDKEI